MLSVKIFRDILVAAVVGLIVLFGTLLHRAIGESLSSDCHGADVAAEGTEQVELCGAASMLTDMSYFRVERRYWLRLTGFWVVALSFTASNDEAASQQPKPQQNRSVFGVQLTPREYELLDDVERRFGKPVREEWLADNDSTEGRSDVGDDGTPIIYIRRSLNDRSVVIVHELYHLVLRNRGYATIEWLFPKEFDTAANHAAFSQLQHSVYDPILHYVFYPESRARLGVDPGRTLEQETGRMIRDGSLREWATRAEARTTVLSYFRLRLELDRATVVDEVASILEGLGKQEAVKSGDRLAEMARAKLQTPSPANAIAAFVDCLNQLFRGQFRFEVRPWKSRILGNHEQAFVPIELKRLAG